MLTDIRQIEAAYGPEGIFSYARKFLGFEQYFSFFEDTVTGAGLSIAAVLVIILFITVSLSLTFIVALCVLLVDLYLLAMIYYWGLTFNSIVVVNICIAIGLSVDYCAHIAHTYQIINPPKHITNKSDIRKYKAAKALSQMGSSVFHGGFSTFLAISALAPSKSYIFEVFFKCWFSIVFFGLCNGFFLLPVILSYIGSADSLGNSTHDESSNNSEITEQAEDEQKSSGKTSTKEPNISPDVEVDEDETPREKKFFKKKQIA